MSAVVEHDKRRREILEKALDVFVEEGYSDTTFQKIADRCGITRTILYLYFKNKREVFIFSIKLFTEVLESRLREVADDAQLSAVKKLERLMELIIGESSGQKKLLTVICDYLMYLARTGGDPYQRLRRRTIRVRHILSGVLIHGQKQGELAKLPVKVVIDMLYSMLEATVFRATILSRTESSDLLAAAKLFIGRLGVCRALEREE
ncbi:MAG: TetR family transcriptional regulator [Spirochaetes bacterium GWD1_61_31]|nr:MAG: TetR family transcriptional regulator [Spirochaetes bacterium GWB1_60_80]OHD29943.1 MAG: TetR family transcriptional regulator [Spirochaetes bacterium GWC1_61_12]OHD43801.1 MAG: TetR family transcriptional regulator [Spirochaetes bacterium GWD1_61_31]OHD46043.1 MAG: TetR family transcriptional regulator [Spirochaetes bacterium GWE1_60_18]OHD60615.1 MAG: TetR family transcriptional regulator [Spirochaetes bacterium GWF1_60_12]HAP43454.1 TetR/AcrR family transcriptional regulator [Spiroc